MLRRHHRFFRSLQLLRDLGLVLTAFAAAFEVRFASRAWAPFSDVPPATQTAALAVLTMALWPLAANARGLYHSRRVRGALSDAYDVLVATLLTFGSLVTCSYFFLDARFSRGVLILWAAHNFVLLSLARFATRSLLERLRMRGFNLRYVVIVGDGELAHQVATLIDSTHALGLRVKGLVSLPQASIEPPSGESKVLRLGTTRDLAALCERGVDQVIIALPIGEMSHLAGVMEALSQSTVDVRLVPDFYQFMTLCGGVENFFGLPLVTLQATSLYGWGRVFKRLFDLTLTSLLLLALSPLLLLLALSVYLSDPGPVFYRQQRIGMDGQVFSMLKFRSMVVNADKQSRAMTQANDGRCTPLGRILRRFSLDELPQLFNVMRGEMSLVGPRPERPHFIEIFKKTIPRYALRNKIKAGMTGWAQVHGMRGNTSIERRIELDLYYIENWSLQLDLKILIRTALGGFLSPHAY